MPERLYVAPRPALIERSPTTYLALFILLPNALLCSSCDAVFERGEQQCPACSGETFMPLERWLPAMESARESA